MCELLTGDSKKSYTFLTAAQREQLSLISGKDRDGKALLGHHHAYFLVWPDQNGYPIRLVVWRREVPFSEAEISGMLSASEGPISWGDEQPLYLVPLPLEMPLPPGLAVSARVWQSVTPFVPPAERHRFRAQGRLRPGETPECVAKKLLLDAGIPAPANIGLETDQDKVWTQLHETRQRRLLRERTGSSFVRPGFRLRLEFDAPVQGPIIMGDSCHFGLGLFRGMEETGP
jgi:CRISPR-associated protein Csb2